MKKLYILIFIIIFSTAGYSQTLMEKYKVGNFSISLPFYMSKTGGLNNDAVLQFRNMVKDVSGYILTEEKTIKEIDDPSNPTINEFYDKFLADFLTDKPDRKVGTPNNSTNGEVKFISTDFSYLDEETMIYYYHFIGIAETKNGFYTVVCTSTLDNKNLFKNDFKKILLSLKD